MRRFLDSQVWTAGALAAVTALANGVWYLVPRDGQPLWLWGVFFLLGLLGWALWLRADLLADRKPLDSPLVWTAALLALCWVLGFGWHNSLTSALLLTAARIALLPLAALPWDPVGGWGPLAAWLAPPGCMLAAVLLRLRLGRQKGR